MTRTHRPAADRPRAQHRSAALLGTVLFFVLAATGVAHASWTTAAVSATGSVTSGSVSVSQLGYDQLKFGYTASGLVTTKPVTVTNGSVPSAYTVTLGATSSSPTALAAAITVLTWPVTTAAACTPATTLPGTQTVRTWASGTTLSGSLAASASVVYCVRTSMSVASVSSYVGGQVAARLDLSATVGTNWKTPTTSVTVVQSVPDVSAPTAPTNLFVTATTDSSATLSWSAATDDVAVVSYRVYRDGVQSGAAPSGTTVTETGLNVGTTYSYTVDALDAAGNVSARSSAVSAPTSQTLSSTGGYRMKSGGMCITGSTSADGAVTVQVCNESLTTQLWQYDPSSGSYFINSTAAAGLVWERPSSSTGAIVVAPRGGRRDQQWRVEPVGNGYFQFTIGPNKNFQDCAYVPATTAGTALQTQSCDSSASNQRFTLTAAN